MKRIRLASSKHFFAKILIYSCLPFIPFYKTLLSFVAQNVSHTQSPDKSITFATCYNKVRFKENNWKGGGDGKGGQCQKLQQQKLKFVFEIRFIVISKCSKFCIFQTFLYSILSLSSWVVVVVWPWSYLFSCHSYWNFVVGI